MFRANRAVDNTFWSSCFVLYMTLILKQAHIGQMVMLSKAYIDNSRLFQMPYPYIFNIDQVYSCRVIWFIFSLDKNINPSLVLFLLPLQMQAHFWRIVQALIALILLILTIVYWSQNQIGQNMINFQAVICWAIGLEHIVIAYRWWVQEQTFEYEVNLLLMVFYVVGKLFQKYHPTTFKNGFNAICEYNVLFLLYLNLAFILMIISVLLCYTVRQIYRLMTQTLLSVNTNLQQQQLDQIIGLSRPYATIAGPHPTEQEATCSICLMEYEPESQVIVLPVCQHSFHRECIKEWLQNRATCPYCRNNIRLSLL